MEPLGPPAGGLGGVAKILKNYHNNRAVETNHNRYRIKVNNQTSLLLRKMTGQGNKLGVPRGRSEGHFGGHFGGHFWGHF